MAENFDLYFKNYLVNKFKRWQHGVWKQDGILLWEEHRNVDQKFRAAKKFLRGSTSKSLNFTVNVF